MAEKVAAGVALLVGVAGIAAAAAGVVLVLCGEPRLATLALCAAAAMFLAMASTFVLLLAIG